MAIDNTVLEKLKKILRLAGDKAATQGEIEAAMARAKEIAMQHSIDLASVDLTNPNEKAKGLDIANDGGLKLGVAFWRKFHPWITHVLQEVFGVRFVTQRRKQGSRERCDRIWIIGETTDVEIAKVLFTWLEELYPKSYHEAVRSFQIPVDDAASQHGYYRGLTAGILEVNRKKEEEIKKEVAQQDAQKAQQWAVVLRSKEDAIAKRMEQEFPHLETKKARAVSYRDQAAAVGYTKGKSINLNQLGGGRNAAGHLN